MIAVPHNPYNRDKLSDSYWPNLWKLAEQQGADYTYMVSYSVPQPSTAWWQLAARYYFFRPGAPRMRCGGAAQWWHKSCASAKVRKS